VSKGNEGGSEVGTGGGHGEGEVDGVDISWR
jgi:hypothetical protein